MLAAHTLLLVLALAPQQSPPIFQPGAPGAPARVITAEAARELGRTTFVAADVDFMRHMIVHHGQAVEMVGLLRDHGQDRRVKLLGERIALSQEAEMALMRNWLIERQQAETAEGPHAGHHGHHAATPDENTPLMPGMLSPAQMRALGAARGAAFDRLFLEGMIQHHQGALDMVSGLLAHDDAAQDPMLSDFATSVVADQSAEILRMRNLLSELSPES